MSIACTLAIVNQKGGVGKTTTAINLATSLAAAGLRCLLVDCDPQANTTGGLGIPKASSRKTAYELLIGESTAREAVVETAVPRLSLIPGSKNLVGANVELVDADDRHKRLKAALQPILPEFDLILLDCPPALDLLTLNALVAADRLLVPMQGEYFALEGISELVNTLKKVQSSLNPGLQLEGVVLTMFDERTNLAQQVKSDLRKFFGANLYETTIPRNIRLAEAPSYGKPVLLYDAKSRGAEAYRALAAELMRRNGLKPAAARPAHPTAAKRAVRS